MADHLTKEIQFVTPSRTVSGVEGFLLSQTALIEKRPDIVLVFLPDQIDYSRFSGLAAESGHWYESWREKGDFTEIRGTYYGVWKLEAGQWRLQSQIFTPLSCNGIKYCTSVEPPPVFAPRSLGLA